MNSFKEESSRCLHCKNPQCKSGCPIKFDVPKFLRLAQNEKFSEAAEVVGHPFGEVCGFVCPRDKQCKGHCVLAAKGNGVDVGLVERSVFAQASVWNKIDGALQNLKVAVVGGGVSGLTFANACYRHGADVTVFERSQLLHTLRSIPTFRLPRETLDRIISAVTSSSIKVEQANICSADVERLSNEFDVVYLACGVMVPNKMRVCGEEFATVADDFLRKEPFGKTVVIGGGNTAMDCARKNAKAGFETIVAYRRSRQDMPAFDSEIAAAESEGVKFVFNVAPVSIQKENELVLTLAKTVSEGRGKLVVTDERFDISCDCVAVATGSSYDTTVYPAQWRLVTDENNRVCQNIFAGGDAVGKNLVSEAVADALNAFRAVYNEYKR